MMNINISRKKILTGVAFLLSLFVIFCGYALPMIAEDIQISFIGQESACCGLDDKQTEAVVQAKNLRWLSNSIMVGGFIMGLVMIFWSAFIFTRVSTWKIPNIAIWIVAIVIGIYVTFYFLRYVNATDEYYRTRQPDFVFVYRLRGED